MRILHVQQTLAPNYGGPTTLLPPLVAAQTAAGHHAEVLTTNVDHPSGAYHEPGWGLLNGRVPVRYETVQFRPLRLSAGLATFLRRRLRRYDVVHVHGLYRFPPTYAAREARRQGIPYIITPHGSLDPYRHDKSTAGSVRLKSLYERWFDLPNLSSASAIHYTTEEEGARAAYLGLKAPSFVVPIGIDWQPFDVLPSRGALRARWRLGEEPVVLFLGRLHFKKGLDLLIPAFDTVRRRLPDAQLVIAGPDNDGYGKTVRAWVQGRGLDDQVHFVGPLYGEDVVQAYVDADVFVLPSYTENFGMTVVEAMASKLPVVISDQVNLQDEVAKAGAGIVTHCDAEEVAEATLALLREPARAAGMGEAGRRLVRDRYTWPSIVDQLTREYEAVIARHRQAVQPQRPRRER